MKIKDAHNKYSLYGEKVKVTVKDVAVVSGVFVGTIYPSFFSSEGYDVILSVEPSFIRLQNVSGDTEIEVI